MLESQQLHYHAGGISNGAAQIAQDPFEFRPLKVEPDALCASQAEELAMLRVRVQQLEREMARLAAENHHLKDLLVKEIPGLLSAMRQTLAPGQGQGPGQGHGSGSGPGPGATSGPGQPDLLCSLSSSSPSSCSSSLAAADGRYGLMPWNDHGTGAGPESIPSISELLRCRHQDLDESMGNGLGDCEDLTGSLEALSGRSSAGIGGGGGGEVMKFELCDDLEDELAPFLRDLGPRGPTATPCAMSPCQQAEMRMRGRPPGCGQRGDHCNELEEVFPGSGVFCDSRALRRANQSATPTAMVRNLLVGVFDKQTLLHSNLRGGSSKTSPFHNHHAPLDPHKLNAIYDATLARFPAVRRAQIGISINSKLSEIRFYTRRASAERSRQ